MAQLDNAADSDSEEQGFESLRAGQKMKSDAEGIALHFLVSKETKGFEKDGLPTGKSQPFGERLRSPWACSRGSGVANPFGRAKK